MNRRRRLWRYLGLDHNPLRRTIDRLEARFRLLLATALVAGGPLLTVTLATRTHQDMAAQAAAQAGHRQATAVVTGSADGVSGPGLDGPRKRTVAATVRLPDGRDHPVRIPAPSRAKPGDHVHIWLNHHGQVVRQPITPFDAAFTAASVAILTPILLTAAAWGLAAAVETLIVRASAPAWEYAWRMIDPHAGRRDE